MVSLTLTRRRMCLPDSSLFISYSFITDNRDPRYDSTTKVGPPCRNIFGRFDVRVCGPRALRFRACRLRFFSARTRSASIALALYDPLRRYLPAVHLAQPLIRAELEETGCWCLDWANSEVIAVGTTNGNVLVD